MPIYIQHGTAAAAQSIKRTSSGKAFKVITARGETKFYPNSSYNNSIICAARCGRKEHQ